MNVLASQTREWLFPSVQGHAHRLAKASRILACLLFLVPAISSAAQAPQSGVLGDWREPGGSVIRILPCGSNVCLYLVQLSSQETHTVDGLNPDPAQRTRPLCNLEIGSGFLLIAPTDAEGGQLYDPKSGRTYRGLMKAEGDQLQLRGYIGVKAFGRTERWTRIPGGLKDTCR